ncbi:MAG: glycosyltransferase family 9 protein, partial [Saprospiraceae bacterium]
YAFILETNPFITKVWAIQSTVSELKMELQYQQFDYIVDLHKNLRTLHLRLFLKSKFLSFRKLNFEKWMMTKFKINRLPNVHIVDRYLATAKSLGIKNDKKGLDYFIPKKDVVDIQVFKQKKQNLIAFAIGAAHSTKRLPTEKIIAICKKIIEKKSIIIVLLGGTTDTNKGEMITKSVGQNIVNLCGQLNLHQSASVVKQSDIVITHDTGMMHIAAAFQKQIISIWGNTIPEFGMFPYVDESKFEIVEVPNLSCRPCSKIGHKACPKGHFKCMNDIDESNLLSKLQLRSE